MVRGWVILCMTFTNFRFLTEDLCSKACELQQKPSTTSTLTLTTHSQTVTPAAPTSEVFTADERSGK